MNQIRERVLQLQSDLIALRHDLHAHPELGFEEYRTAGIVTDWLKKCGLEVRAGVAGTGVVGTLRGESGEGMVVGFRADMDALPIEEQNDLPYRSQYPGKMHACGHDGHTTILLGAAAVLAQLRAQLRGTVRFYFQPAEEGVSGAKAMLAKGVLQEMPPRWVIALHGRPGLPLGSVGVRAGAMMASADTFDIWLKGRGGHAALPHLTDDPIVAGAQLVQALQLLASRESAPSDPVVLSVTQFHAGNTYNVLPEEIHLAGTVRCLREESRSRVRQRTGQLVDAIAQAWHLAGRFEWHDGVPVLWNDQTVITRIARAAEEAFGREKVIWLEHPLMGAEDFACFAQAVPSAMFFLGLGEVADWHTACFDFPDEALAPGVEMFVRLALAELGT
ncbi:MAG: peptidase M20 [Armatimonadota bacterium]|nr:MAG: peptidase M20 [Armatimonadota bacterium]